MQLRKYLILVILFTALSCTNKKLYTNKKCIDTHEGETRYTYSKVKNVDFVVSGGGYVLLYDYSKPVDTIFNYCGTQKIGKDSLIYTRIRKNLNSNIPFENQNTYYGYCEGLYLYDGKKSRQLFLPYFNPHFSSFIVHKKDIYYWASCNNNKMSVIKYNLKVKKYLIKNTDIICATDYYAHFHQPYIQNNQVHFKTESGDYCQYDLNLHLLKQKNTNYLEFENDTIEK